MQEAKEAKEAEETEEKNGTGLRSELGQSRG